MDLSVIIPIHNEQENIEFLYNELKENIIFLKKYEIIFVDDGSIDKSFEILEKIARKDKLVKVIKFRSRRGQSIAIRAGLDFSSGEKIIIMDGDGQHNPKFIIDFYKKLDNYDVVCNYRKNHQKFTTPIGNFLIKNLFKVPYKDSIGGMKGLRKQVKENVYLYGDMHRYLPLMALWKGFKVGEQEIILRQRRAGKSKYRPMKAFRGFIDLLTIKFLVSYSSRPSHIFGSAGILSSGIGGISLFYLLFNRIFFGSAIGNHLPIFLLSILLVLLGFNFIFFGFLGDMISYNHMSQLEQKNYIVFKTVNLKL